MRQVAADTAGIRLAAETIRAGGLVAFPTETVYGLGADATQEEAVLAIFRAKGRPPDNPLIVHVASAEDARALAANWPPLAERLAARFWPGPLTLVVESGPVVALAARAGLGTVGIRWPRHPVAEALIRESRRPIAAPSANRSGRPSPTRAAAVAEDLAAADGILLDGGDAGIGVESTVVALLDRGPVLLRPGGLPLEAVEAVAGAVSLPGEDEPVRAPGMKYRHYAPRCPVILVRADGREAVARIRREFSPRSTGLLAAHAVVAGLPEFLAVDLGEDARTAAAALFAGLRQLERAPGIERIVAVWDQRDGLGRAVLNRLEKAAGVDVR